MSKARFSAVLITLNEESNLDACLAALSQVTNDIVIIDGFSIDRTEEIAKSYKANFIQSKWYGYAKTKNLGCQYVQNDWILSIDADEVLSSDLIKTLQNVDPQRGTVYLLDRMTNYCGQWIKHCGWYPDWKPRLFHKEEAQWEGEFVHETLVLAKTSKRVKLDGILEHYSYKTHQEHLERNTKYAKLAAEQWIEEGKKIGRLKRCFAPSFRFFKTFVIRLGILDGKSGYVISKHDAKMARQKIEFYNEIVKSS